MQTLKERVLLILRSSPHSKSPEAECERIFFEVLRKTRTNIRHPRDLISLTTQPAREEESQILHLARERAAGRPLQHLLGHQFFYSREYRVDSSTLIPRPESEVLVDEAIHWARARFGDRPFRFAELGLGSGALSGEILSHFPAASGVASEVSQDAIALARSNLGRSLARISILEPRTPCEGFAVFEAHAPFDLVISNPPYLSRADEIDAEVLAHEPESALFPAFPDEQPSFFYLDFLARASKILAPGGAVFFEIPHERADEIHSCFLHSPLVHVKLIPDLTGRFRVLSAESP